MKSAILQLNTRYCHDCFTENADKTNCVELIWKDEYPPNSSDLNPLEYHVWAAMLDMYQCYTTKPTNTYEVKNVVQAIWADLSQGLN